MKEVGQGKAPQETQGQVGADVPLEGAIEGQVAGQCRTTNHAPPKGCQEQDKDETQPCS